MNRFITIIRFFTLGAAFLGVMAFAGALLGAIGGMILVLLSHTVLGWSAGALELLPGSVAVGLAGFTCLGVALTAPHAPSLMLHPAQIPAQMAANSESN